MTETPGYRPLYPQVYDIIVRRIADGVWRSGEALPSEHALGIELKVSQGTIRKVLDALTAEKILERRQGKGTFIAENTQARALFRFFKMTRLNGERVSPECGEESVQLRPGTAVELAKLGLATGDQVVAIQRTRLIDGKPAIREHIAVPAAMFPGLEHKKPLPNTLYSLYQTDYGINIVMANEDLRADLANDDDVHHLKVSAGTAILCVDRIALTIPDRKAEWRVSRIASNDLVYRISLN